MGLISFAEDHGINVLHIRPGPYLEGQEDTPEGGPYKAREDGKVWLGQWNDAWWQRQEYLIWEAGNRGIRVEIGMTDLWRARNALSGAVEHPWLPEFNVHGVDRLHGLGGGGQFNDAAAQWFARIVKRFGRFGNVHWFDGTEASIMPGWSAQSTWALRRMVQELQSEYGYPAHMFGSNGTAEAQAGNVDYATVHGRFPRQQREDGTYFVHPPKPHVWQEYNGGDIPLTADQWMLHACEARKAGTYLAFWRGWRPMPADDVLDALRRWDTDDCSFLNARALPGNVPGWGTPFEGAFTKQDAFVKARNRIWNPCGKHPTMSLKMLAFELQQDGEYAGVGGDAVYIWDAPRKAFNEIHWVSFGDGCPVGQPYKGTHPFTGTLPPPLGAEPGPECSAPRPRLQPDTMWFSLGQHSCPSGPCWDSTWMVKNQPGYCDNWWSDGRLRCPVRPEGHPQRESCENLLRGGQLWWCDGEPIQSLPGNVAQAECKGHVKTCDQGNRWCAEADW
jgi:hypothetical protein